MPGTIVTVVTDKLGPREQAAPKLFDLGGTAWQNGVAMPVGYSESPVECNDFRDDFLQAGEYFIGVNESVYGKSSNCSFNGHPPIFSQLPAPRFEGFMQPTAIYRMNRHKSFLGWPHAMGESGVGADTLASGRSVHINYMYRSNVDQLQYYRFELEGNDSGDLITATDDYWTLGESVVIDDGERQVTAKVLDFNSTYGHLHVAVDVLGQGRLLEHSGTITGEESGEQLRYTKRLVPGSNKYLRIWDEQQDPVFRSSLTGTEGLYGGGGDSDRYPKLFLSKADQAWHNIMYLADLDNKRLKAFVDGVVIYDVEAPLADVQPDASPTIALLGVDNNASSQDGYEFMRVQTAEIYVSRDKQAVFIGNHGDIYQVSNLCAQYITEWDEQLNEYSFNYRDCGIDPDSAYLFMLNDQLVMHEYGYSLKDGMRYQPTERYWPKLDGRNDMLGFADRFTFSESAWYYDGKIKPVAGYEGDFVLAAYSAASRMRINDDNTVTVHRHTSNDVLSDKIRTGEWWRFRFESSVNSGLILKVAYADGDSDTIQISETPVTGFYFDRIGVQPNRDYHRLDGIADLDINGEHFYSLNDARSWSGSTSKDEIGNIDLYYNKLEPESQGYGRIPILEFD
ncbi:hypothetical protein DU002_11910 [Corallincola holothuriorum]|uniref:Uncharacterized protein n=1 Tax=Corallincola holothuriorum TaxID=2282215 RepID=A0A368NGA5_9GAMM|nr:hypothetical protein DU002_11910 [Corallincola holothuriorum]